MGVIEAEAEDLGVRFVKIGFVFGSGPSLEVGRFLGPPDGSPEIRLIILGGEIFRVDVGKEALKKENGEIGKGNEKRERKGEYGMEEEVSV